MIVCVAPSLRTHYRPTVQGDHGEWMHVRTGDGFTDELGSVTCPTCNRYEG